MTVAELIAKLQEQDPEALAYIDEGPYPVTSIETNANFSNIVFVG